MNQSELWKWYSLLSNQFALISNGNINRILYTYADDITIRYSYVRNEIAMFSPNDTFIIPSLYRRKIRGVSEYVIYCDTNHNISDVILYDYCTQIERVLKRFMSVTAIE